MLSFSCCAAVQGIEQQFVMVDLQQSNQNPRGQFELMEPKTGHESFCWLSLLFLAIEAKLGGVLNLTVEVFLIFFCDSS